MLESSLMSCPVWTPDQGKKEMQTVNPVMSTHKIQLHL